MSAAIVGAAGVVLCLVLARELREWMERRRVRRIVRRRLDAWIREQETYGFGNRPVRELRTSLW